MKHVAVVGGSLAGLSAARALREQGYDGRLTIVAAERHRPYDRPPLSKDFLAGTTEVEDLWLERDGEDLAAEWRTGMRAERLDPPARRIGLSDGSDLDVDGVVLATGATPRTLDGHPPAGGGPPLGAPPLAGVHTLRTLDDAVALRADLVPGARFVVIGAGFIGAEVASTARGLGVDTTVVEVAATPLAGPLGAEMGGVVAGLHRRHGVRLLCGVGVRELTGDTRVGGIELADGRILPADVVLVAVGAAPCVDWLRGSGIEVGNGVLCDAGGQTSVPNVVAVGDCSAWRDARTGEHRRIEHWTAARDRPSIAVATLLTGAAPKPERAPYFWSDQYGVRLQFAGVRCPGDTVDIEVGDAAAGSFLAVYRRGDEPVAVLGVDQVREFSRWRRRLT